MDKDIVVELTVKKHTINKKAGEPSEYVVTLGNKDPNWTLTIRTANVGYLHGLPRGETFTVRLEGSGQLTLDGEPTPGSKSESEETTEEEESL